MALVGRRDGPTVSRDQTTRSRVALLAGAQFGFACRAKLGGFFILRTSPATHPHGSPPWPAPCASPTPRTARRIGTATRRRPARRADLRRKRLQRCDAVLGRG